MMNILWPQVLAEAQNSAGTWSLATHTKLDSALSGGTESDVEAFMSAVIKRVISPSAEEGERFKLAQLCTMAREKQYGKVEQVFLRYKNDLVTTARSVSTTQLGNATAQLIRSLFTERSDDRDQGRAPFGLRRRSFRPYVVQAASHENAGAGCFSVKRNLM
jgi:hypothetical protein